MYNLYERSLPHLSLFVLLQLNNILVTIEDPQYTITNPATAVPKPSPNPVSTLLRVGGGGTTFDVIFPISPNGGATTGSLASQKLNVIPTTVKNGLSAAIDPAGGMLALSLFDFGNYALQVEQAIDKLDAKIREILDGSAITCP